MPGAARMRSISSGPVARRGLRRGTPTRVKFSSADEQSLGSETGIDRRRVVQRAREEQRTEEQRDGQRDLRDDQRAAKRHRVAAGGRAARAGAHDGRRGHPRAAQGRREAEEQAGRDAESGGEAEHPPVEPERQRDRVVARFERRHQRPSHRPGEQHREGGANRDEHQTLGQQLPHHASARGAEPEPDRDLALARAGARQQQVGEVRAGDHQDHAGDGEQEPQRRSVVLAQLGHAGAAGVGGELEVQDTARR